MKNRFQSLPFKCDLQRYNMADNHLGPEGCQLLLESLKERNNVTVGRCKF
jgi:hypothetical protein